VNSVMNFRNPYNAGKLFPGWERVSFTRRSLLHGVSKYHTERKGKREAVCVLRTHARTYSDSVFMVNKNIHLQFCWMGNYIALFSILPEIITGFT